MTRKSKRKRKSTDTSSTEHSSEYKDNSDKMATTREMSNEDLYTKLSEKFEATISELRTEIQDLHKSLGLMEETIRRHEEKIMALENGMEVAAKVTSDTAEAMNNLEQYGRKYAVEISGVSLSEQSAEAATEATLKISKVLDLDITEADIDICHPIKRKSQGLPVIIAKFKSCNVSGKLYRARIKLRKVKTERIGLHPSSKTVYINENLTKKNAEIFHHARTFVEERKWYSAWTHNGISFVKKTKDSKLVRFNDIGDK
ncbi:tropomyosin-like [Ptychodera flava]|uniref:tropomyosin-like n=1 Tax=Ptychodera flava TaxID=63121 RepID=UPI00396A82F9